MPVSSCTLALGRAFTSHCAGLLLQKGQEETSFQKKKKKTATQKMLQVHEKVALLAYKSNTMQE